MLTLISELEGRWFVVALLLLVMSFATPFLFKLGKSVLNEAISAGLPPGVASIEIGGANAAAEAGSDTWLPQSSRFSADQPAAPPVLRPWSPLPEYHR